MRVREQDGSERFVVIGVVVVEKGDQDFDFGSCMSSFLSLFSSPVP